MKQGLFLLLLLFCLQSRAQFRGQSGVYYLGAANIPIPAATMNNPNISGIVIRFRWNDTEPTPGNFNWSFVDGEIAKAVAANKKVSLQPLGIPTWMAAEGAQQYYYIDENTLHATYGQVVSGILTWDTVYVNRYKRFMQNMADKYAADTAVAYINTNAVYFSRNLPDSILTDTTQRIQAPFWTAYDYNADTLAVLMNEITDNYMALFPNTPLWCSVDHVRFEQNASGRYPNYLASLYTAYGVSHYADRFGLFREDISGCNPAPTINPGNQWILMQQNHCRTGAQMLWSVQDGPTRMNRCGISPNTEQVVLDSAIKKALQLDMRYLEIYGADIADATLTATIQQGNADLISNGISCGTIVPVMIERFTATCNGNGNYLSWTAAVSSSDRFSIQKSFDAVWWTDIAPVGNNGTRQYSFFDAEQSPCFYRIAITSAGGTTTYSTVIAAGNCRRTAMFTVYPNPAGDAITITGQPLLSPNNSIKIFEVGGRLIKETAVGLYNTVNTSRLAPGVYFMSMAAYPGAVIMFIKR